MFRGGTCKHKLLVCLHVIRTSEEKFGELQNRQNLGPDYVDEAHVLVDPEVGPKYIAQDALKEEIEEEGAIAFDRPKVQHSPHTGLS